MLLSQPKVELPLPQSTRSTHPDRPPLLVQVAKRHTPGMVVRPVCMAPTLTVADLYDLKAGVGRALWAHAACAYLGQLHSST